MPTQQYRRPWAAIMDDNGRSGYEAEPKEHFAPLPARLYAAFHHLETRAAADESYYREQLRRHHCQTVLELGCGTGRITEYLHHSGFSVVGIDNCRAMLTFDRAARQAATIEMDMGRLGLQARFDAAIIAGNTLNLLQSREAINRCLQEVRTVLQPAGLLVLHLFVPDRRLIDQAGQRFFQFALFDLPGGGTLVKETLRSYDPRARRLHLEERYKLRFLPGNAPPRNYRQSLRLAALPADEWRAILETAGFKVRHLQADFNGRPYQNGVGTKLLVTARIL